MSKSIAIYGSHDSSICINPNEGEYRIYEFERLLQERYCKLNDKTNFKDYLKMVYDEIVKEYGHMTFETCYYGQLSNNNLEDLKNVFGCEKFVETPHHPSHAACAYYQSNFDDALIISQDGGGFDNGDVVTFKIFTMLNGILSEVDKFSIDLGNSYTLMSLPISEVNKDGSSWGLSYLSFAGKMMGLTAYGKVRNEWVDLIRNFYSYQRFDGSTHQLDGLMAQLNLPRGVNSLSGEIGYDLAATAQYVFETMTYDLIIPYINKYNLPVIMTGGCALNVLFNQILKDRLSVPLFIPPNPNDCGLSFGKLVLNEPPKEHVKLTYNGFGLLDRDDFDTYVEKYDAKKVTVQEVAELIVDGKIIGLVQGNSEVGPRALGNRSIICDPSYENMKDILNAKVKFREWFRPFAPVVRAEEVEKFFEFKGEAEYMSFAPKVKEEFRGKLASITHVDGTARVQTVTEEQNKYLYDIITEIDKIKNIGVILNTSFNIKGKPILTKIEEALYVLENTDLDYVLINEYLFKQK